MAKSWALFHTGMRWRIQADDEVCADVRWRWPCLANTLALNVGDDHAAVRRARLEARKGRREAMSDVAFHQREKRR